MLGISQKTHCFNFDSLNSKGRIFCDRLEGSYFFNYVSKAIITAFGRLKRVGGLMCLAKIGITSRIYRFHQGNHLFYSSVLQAISGSDTISLTFINDSYTIIPENNKGQINRGLLTSNQVMAAQTFFNLELETNVILGELDSNSRKLCPCFT